jgi:hypothetical protein
MDYGDENNCLMKIINPQPVQGTDITMKNSGPEVDHSESFTITLGLFLRTYDIILRRTEDTNMLPFFHVTLSFMYYMSRKDGLRYLKTFPWNLTASMLNCISDTLGSRSTVFSEKFPGSDEEYKRPLPEDFAQRGLPWTEDYYPVGWFNKDDVNDDEKYFEVPSLKEERQKRCLWLGVQISRVSGSCLLYDKSTHEFSVARDGDIEIMPSTRITISIDWKADAAQS